MEAEADEQKAKDTSPSKHWGCGSESTQRGILGLNADFKRLGTERRNKQPLSVLPLPTANNNNNKKKKEKKRKKTRKKLVCVSP